MRVAAFALLATAVPSWALLVAPSRQAGALTVRRAPDAPVMMPKSKKPSRKKTTSGKKSAAPPTASISAPPTAMAAQESLMDFAGAPKDVAAPSVSREGTRNERIDAALRSAGLSPEDGDSLLQPPSAPSSLDPLSRIPKKGQELLERFFSTGALIMGGVFITAGLGVSVEAIAKVSGNPLPIFVDEILVQYVEPALTPSILTLFGFSISLGVLKQLQFTSETDSMGVLYREEDD